MTITEANPMRTTTLPHVTVLVDRCVGCQECIVRCPTTALTLDVPTMHAVAHDEDCVGCRQCERTCPFSAIQVSGPMLVTDRTHLSVQHPAMLAGDTSETRSGIGSWDAAVAEATRCLTCPDPTCVRGCPAHNDIPSFIAAVRERDLGVAHDVLTRTSMMPDICARVCDQAVQCEGACTWSLAGGQPVAIGALERFICDNSPVPAPVVAAPAGARVKVAVIGSGPAGLAAAWELVSHGADVTVYDKDDHAGGLLRWGIPEFTLPAAVADRPIDALMQAGVNFRLGTKVEPADIDSLAKDLDAVIVATGAGTPMRLKVKGADSEGVWDATRFLMAGQAALASGAGVDVLAPRNGRPSKVLVLGAGNTAMDVARTARRLGADVTCIDWMDRRFAPVRPDELEEAETEGVTIRFTTTLESIESSDGRVTGATLAHTRQRSASNRPKVSNGAAERLEVDLVVMAMGYGLDPAVAQKWNGLPIRKTTPDFIDRRWIASGLFHDPRPAYARHQPVGLLALGRETARVAAAAPRAAKVWVVGDALIGPATVVEAMTHGKEAALAVLAAATPR